MDRTVLTQSDLDSLNNDDLSNVAGLHIDKMGFATAHMNRCMTQFTMVSSIQAVFWLAIAIANFTGYKTIDDMTFFESRLLYTMGVLLTATYAISIVRHFLARRALNHMTRECAMMTREMERRNEKLEDYIT